jgi:hypothetical protein
MGEAALHTLSFRGLAGIMFCLLCGAWFFIVLGYATPYWTKTDVSSLFKTNLNANFYFGLFKYIFRK